MDKTELCFTPATTLLEMIGAKEISPVETMQVLRKESA